MSVEKRFKKRYKTGDTPWDIGKPDFNLTETVAKKQIKSCKTLDIGCGTGDNSVWLAWKHFQVTGTDISEIAIKKARETATKKAAKRNATYGIFKAVEYIGPKGKL